MSIVSYLNFSDYDTVSIGIEHVFTLWVSIKNQGFASCCSW